MSSLASKQTSELDQYMLIVMDSLKGAKECCHAVHYELLNFNFPHTVKMQNCKIDTESRHVHFIHYDQATIEDIRGSHYTQVVITEHVDHYNRGLALSRLRGKGELMFKVGYNDMWEVVGLVNKFLGVSDE